MFTYFFILIMGQKNLFFLLGIERFEVNFVVYVIFSRIMSIKNRF